MKYAALLRGINVGGKNTVKMETLRSTLSSLGFENVKTYINSGNAVFETRKTADTKLAKKIHDAIKLEFGLDISIMVRSIDEIVSLIDNNPFEGKFDDHKNLHIFFLAEPLSEEQTSLLFANESENEMFIVRGREIYYLLRISIIDSVLGKGFIDKKLKVAATARNWRTIEKLASV